MLGPAAAPIPALLGAQGVNEDSQLGLEDRQNLNTPKVVEAFLGVRLSGRTTYRTPLVAGSRNTLAIDADGQVRAPAVRSRRIFPEGIRGRTSRGRRLQRSSSSANDSGDGAGGGCLQVWSWGWNDRATLGLGHRNPVNKPQRLTALTHTRIAQVTQTQTDLKHS